MMKYMKGKWKELKGGLSYVSQNSKDNALFQKDNWGK